MPMNPRQRSVADGWIELESDPGLFSILIENFGVRGVEVEEIYDLQSSLEGPVYGFIFLFKWLEGLRRTRRNPKFELAPGFTVTDENIVNSIFFAQQKVQNSCATHAILSVLMNREDIDLGPTLNKLKAFTTNMTPENKGTALNNIPDLVYAHNKHARPDACRDFEDESDRGSCSTATTTTVGGSSSAFSAASSARWQETFHFASFLPIGNHLYEMDSLKSYPIDHGLIPDGMEWHQYFMQLLYDRIVTANDNDSHEIRYNLMAIVPCKLDSLREKRELMQSNRDQLIGIIKLLVLATEPDIFRRVFQMSSFTSRKKLSDAEILQAAHYLNVTDDTNETQMNSGAEYSTNDNRNFRNQENRGNNSSGVDASVQIDVVEPLNNPYGEGPVAVTELSCCASNAAHSALTLLCSRPIDDFEICRRAFAQPTPPAVVGSSIQRQSTTMMTSMNNNCKGESSIIVDDVNLMTSPLSGGVADPALSSAINDNAVAGSSTADDDAAGGSVVVELSAAATTAMSSGGRGATRKAALLRFGAADDAAPSDVEVLMLKLKELVQLLKSLDEEIVTIDQLIEDQIIKHKNYKVDDQRRTHDYDQFITTFFSMLYQNGHLPMIDSSKSSKKKPKTPPTQQQPIKSTRRSAKRSK